MSTLTGTSTLAEIQAAYADNGSFEEDASPAKARAFITAGRLLLMRLPTSSGHSGNQLQFNLQLIRQEMERARQWLAASSTTGADGSQQSPARYASFHNFR